MVIYTSHGYIEARDRRTGARLWRAGDSWKCLEPLSAPTVDGDAVYYGSCQGYLYRLDRKTGRTVWRQKFGSNTQLRSSPVVWRDRVIIGGEFVFDHKRERSYYRLHAYDTASGKLLWRQPVQRPSSPALGSGRLVLTEGRSVVARDPLTGKEQWQYRARGAIQATDTDDHTPAIAGNVIYGRDLREIFALSLQTGIVKWRHQARCTSLVVAGRIVVCDARLALTAEKGRVLWRAKHKVGLYSPPRAAGGILYFGDSSTARIRAVDLATGRELWRFRVRPWAIRTAPVPADGALFFLTTHGLLYALHKNP